MFRGFEINVDSRCAPPHYALSLRPPRQPRAANRALAPRAALPLAYLKLFAKGFAQRSLINWQQDPQANYLARLVFPETTNEFRIEVDLVAEMAVINPFDFFLEPHAEHYPFEYESWEEDELAPYLKREPLTPLFERYLCAVPREKIRSVDFLVELNRRLARDD